MSDLQTPRAPGAPEDEWAPEIEALLAEFGEIALCNSWLHTYSTRKYKRKHHSFAIPIIVLSTLTGTANFAIDSYVPVPYQHGFSACVGGLNILCGVLGTLASFLRYAELYEGHRVSALNWSALGRSVQIELSLAEGRRKSCRDFLKASRATYDSLLESSPSIDQDVVNVFNKRFADDYPNVSKPIQCNGLREIVPFAQREARATAAPAAPAAPAAEPEPEPA